MPHFPCVIVNIIIEYVSTGDIVLRSWVDEKKLSDHELCTNPNAGEYIMKMWHSGYHSLGLYENPNPLFFSLMYSSYSVWFGSQSYASIACSANPCIIDIGHFNPRSFASLNMLKAVSANPHPDVIQQLRIEIEGEEGEEGEEDTCGVDWKKISANPGAMDIIHDYPEKVDYNALCANPAAINIIKNRKNKGLEIDVRALSSNPHPEAVEMIEKYYLRSGKVNWSALHANPAAIDLIRKLGVYDKYYASLSKNTAIFIPKQDVRPIRPLLLELEW